MWDDVIDVVADHPPTVSRTHPTVWLDRQSLSTQQLPSRVSCTSHDQYVDDVAVRTANPAVAPWCSPKKRNNKLIRSVLTIGRFEIQGVRVVRCQVYASALAAVLLIGSLGTAFAQTTVGGVGIGAAGAGTGAPGLAAQSPSVATPGANLSFFTDPLSVGPSQIPPTGPIGSDPLRVGPSGSSVAAVRGTTNSEACGFPNCLPGED